jgi:hypothetical protein
VSPARCKRAASKHWLSAGSAAASRPGCAASSFASSWPATSAIHVQPPDALVSLLCGTARGAQGCVEVGNRAGPAHSSPYLLRCQPECVTRKSPEKFPWLKASSMMIFRGMATRASALGLQFCHRQQGKLRELSRTVPAHAEGKIKFVATGIVPSPVQYPKFRGPRPLHSRRVRVSEARGHDSTLYLRPPVGRRTRCCALQRELALHRT